MKYLFKLIWWLMGWEIEGNVPRDEKKYIIIMAPHTSNSDFFVGLVARGVMGFNSKYLGKKSLFKAPYGWFFRMTGGYPVDRSKNNNLVDQVVDLYNSHNEFVIGIAPEGTRKNVGNWKTGFYYIADKGKIPIVRCIMDKKRKLIKFLDPFWTTGDIELDLPNIKEVYNI